MNYLKDFTPGCIITLNEENWPPFKPNRSFVRTKGLALDDHMKRAAIKAGGTVPDDPFAKYDFMLEHVNEIKTSDGTWISVSYGEYQLAIELLATCHDVMYNLALQLPERNKLKFIGIVPFSVLLRRCKCERSIFANPYKDPVTGTWRNELGWRFGFAEACLHILPYDGV